MPLELVGRTLYALCVVFLLLFGLAWIAQRFKRGRLVAGTRRRLVSVIETTMVGPQTALHVIKVADRYYLVGSGAAGFSLLTDVPEAEATAWLAVQAEEDVAAPPLVRAIAQRLRGLRKGREV